jgi:hypothetical protein
VSVQMDWEKMGFRDRWKVVHPSDRHSIWLPKHSFLVRCQYDSLVGHALWSPNAVASQTFTVIIPAQLHGTTLAPIGAATFDELPLGALSL